MRSLIAFSPKSSRRGRRSFIIEIPSSSFPPPCDYTSHKIVYTLCVLSALPKIGPGFSSSSSSSVPSWSFTGTGQPFQQLFLLPFQPLLLFFLCSLFFHFDFFFFWSFLKTILRHFRARLKHTLANTAAQWEMRVVSLFGWVPVYVYISIASLLTQEPRRSAWSLCVGGVTGTVFFFFFLRGTFGKGDRSDDFFLLYSHIYTAGYFAFKFQCTSPLFVCSREGKKWPSMTDVKLRKCYFYFLFLCVLCAAATKLFRALKNKGKKISSHNTRPYNRLFCGSSFVHSSISFLVHTIKTFSSFHDHMDLSMNCHGVSFSLIGWGEVI